MSHPLTTASDLRARTPSFWKDYVLPKIEGDFRALYRFLNSPDGRNEYLEAIQGNMARLSAELGQSSSPALA